jgi:hypothetical protein
MVPGKWDHLWFDSWFIYTLRCQAGCIKLGVQRPCVGDTSPLYNPQITCIWCTRCFTHVRMSLNSPFWLECLLYSSARSTRSSTGTWLLSLSVSGCITAPIGWAVTLLACIRDVFASNPGWYAILTKGLFPVVSVGLYLCFMSENSWRISAKSGIPSLHWMSLKEFNFCFCFRICHILSLLYTASGLHDQYPLENMKVIKSREVWCRVMQHAGRRWGVCGRVLSRETKGTNPLAKLDRRWENNIKMCLI